MIFNKGERIVFAGDSVTDDGRDYPVGESVGVNGLGNGYVRQIAVHLAVDYPELLLRTVNMGISGNTTRDLLSRWDSDVTAFEPDTVVLCIGFNDVWRQFDAPAQTGRAVSPEEYRANLNKLADKTSARMIWLTPYYLENNPEDAMRKRMDEYRAIFKEVARERGFLCVDLQEAFKELLKHYYPAYITWDRVLPGPVGSLVIARAFLRAVGAERSVKI